MMTHRLGRNSIYPNARKRKVLRWTEMTYAKQIRGITGFDGWLHSLTCCNGKVYATIKVFDITISALLVEVDMTVNSIILLKGSCTELFTIVLAIKEKTSMTLGAVNVFKLDTNNKKCPAIASSEFSGNKPRASMDNAQMHQDKDDAIVVRSAKCDHEVEFSFTKDESHLLNSLFRVLKMIKEFCAGVECFKLL
ncbi:hypothetical protein Tco_1060553 [Tanacetum coccineum]